MRSQVFPRWILRGLGDEELRVQPFDAPRPERWVILPPMFVVGYLRGWLQEPDARRVLLDIHASLFGPLRGAEWSADEVALAIGPALAQAFERKDLVVLMPWRRSSPGVRPGPTIPPPPPPQKKDEEKTWIEVELYCLREPVPNEDVVVTPQGGGPIKRKLDAEGFARIEGIPAGLCKVEFPNIDAREWGFALLTSGDAPVASGDILETGADEDHEVAQGEDLVVIASSQGFRNWQTIYRYDRNASFRALRLNPDILFPKDRLVIPGKRRKAERASTSARHRFYLHPPTRFLRIRLWDAEQKAIAMERYRLFIDGSLLSEERSTGADGTLEEEIPITARSGSLTAKGYTWELDIAALNPIEEAPDDGVTGAQGRLLNLGYDVGPIDGALGPRTIEAIRRFQRDHAGEGLADTGKLDAATRKLLVRVHGS